NASWALKLLAALHGQSMIKKLYFDAMHDANAYGEFRVSQGNYEFHREKSKDKTMAADSRAYMDSRYKGIKAAYDEGKQWYREGDTGWLALAWFKLTHLLVSAEPKQNTVLLTSPRCASACLDFADAALLIPDAVHMGQETSADTNYLDVRWPPIALPSQQGSLVLPMKVWRNRPRGHNEPHVPEHIYDGNITDTQTIQAWVVNTLNLDKADL
ncbi:MAG TPA: hypothetical protein VIC08_09415, partial [Cellvibrionaceae bacterium]